MEQKKQTKFIIGKREIGKIVLCLIIAIMMLTSLKTIATTIIAGSADVIEDEKTIVRTAASVSRGASSNNKVELASLTTELGRYASTTVTKISSELIQVKFNRTGNIYEINVNIGPTFDIPINTRPYLPAGYTPVANTDLETGFVIQDKNGNQYVWVEVPRTSTVYPTAGINVTTFNDATYNNIKSDLKTYTNAYARTDDSDIYYSDEATGLTESEFDEQKKKMLKSIYINGGFYVGRYETGIDYSEGPRTASGDTTQTPVIKQNAYPYMYVDVPQSQTLAESFATTGYITSLMFDMQWNLTMKYLETKGVTQDELVVDSKAWGNYRDNLYNITNASAKYSTDYGDTWSSAPYNKESATIVLLTTGASDTFCKQNIYDLAGNAYEWTLGVFQNSAENIQRGNYYGASSVAFAAAVYGSAGFGTSTYTKGFRVALYKDEIDTTKTPTYIPTGYTHIAGNMDEGYVIADPSGNEYVWVDVPRTAEVYPTAGTNITTFTSTAYDKIEADLHTYTSAYHNANIFSGINYVDEYSGNYDATGMTENEYYNLKNKMLKSIYINGGFYVGRYEAGVTENGSNDVVIKQHTYGFGATCKNAQTISSNFAPEGYIGSLMFGVQWDLVLKYIEKNGTSQTDILNSTGWGNHSDSRYNITNTDAEYNIRDATQNKYLGWVSAPYNKTESFPMLLTTGASIQFAKQNIYDIAGNYYEWTLEYSSDSNNPCTVRSGSGENSGAVMSAALHRALPTTNGNQSFRVCLYKDETNAMRAPTYIPSGYTHIAGDMDSGYVIADASGNEYVWVEVPRTAAVYPTAGLNITNFTDTEYTKIENDLHTYTSVYRQTGYTDTWSSQAATGLSESQYTQQKKKMLKSVYKNGGFYVGRYETGIDYGQTHRTAGGNTTQTAVIKQNAYPYNFVTTSQSQSLASGFATEGYTSSLMFGVQWDLILKYLETKGATQDELLTNSTSWGNYLVTLYNITNTSAKYSSDSAATWASAPYNKETRSAILLTTGASEVFSKQNIYDFAGNSWEWTLERSNNESKPCTPRSCSADSTGIHSACAVHGENTTEELYYHATFRVALYKEETDTRTPTYIPQGYTHIAGNMDEGYVIADPSGNEYVWVEVPRTAEVYPTAGTYITAFTEEAFNKIENDLRTYTNEYRITATAQGATDTWHSEAETGLTETEYNTQKKKMLKSIYVNGGFYVGRYETGIDYSQNPRLASTEPVTQNPVIKQNAYPYNFVTTAQAQELSERFKITGYETNLIFGLQWDLILKYFEKSGAATQSELTTDSTSWGNYMNNLYNITNTRAKYIVRTLSGDGLAIQTEWSQAPYQKNEVGQKAFLTTGASETFEKQNIYDLAGNLWEWTMEHSITTNEPVVSRGGDNGQEGSGSPVCSYSDRTINYLASFITFRVSLFKDEGVELVRSYDASNLDGHGTTGVATTTLKDLSGYHDATIYGNPTFGNGYISLNEGSSTEPQYIDLGPIFDLETVTVNLKFSVSEIGTTMYLMGNWDSAGMGVGINSAGKLYWEVYNENSTAYDVIYSTDTLQTNTIYDVTGIYDGTKIYLYINGTLEGTKVTTNGGNIKNPGDIVNVFIGANPSSDSGDSDGIDYVDRVGKMKLYSASVSEAVDDKLVRNIFTASMILNASTTGNVIWDGSKVVINSSSQNTDTAYQHIKVQKRLSATHVESLGPNLYSTGKYSNVFVKDATFNQIWVLMNGNVADYGVRFDVSSLTNGKSYTLEFDVTSYGTYTATIENIRILE